MTVHLNRDFLTLPSSPCPGTNMYALSMFLVHVGGYNLIGQTNFDVLTGSVMLGFGISGSINFGSGTYEVLLPPTSYTVSSADVDRIVALRSQLYPLANSGLFRILSVDVPNNGLVVDYRSSASPPPEQFLSWRIFEKETVFAETWQTGSNGIVSGYGSFNATTASVASASRIILQSPDQTSWQVRMCLESPQDVSGAVPSGFSIAPGFAGNSNGDFSYLTFGAGRNQPAHLHAAQWYNTTSSLYRGMTVGLSPYLGANGQWRISMIIDDVSGTCGIVNQNVSLPTTTLSGSGWSVFGLSQDETEIPAPNNLGDPMVNVRRLFVVGSSNPQSNMSWQSQFHSDNVTQVVGFSKYGYPVAGVLSLYANILNSGSHVRYLSQSVDNVWNAETELLDAEILLGTVDVTFSSTTSASLWQLQPRRLGRLPFFMQGRANYVNWAVTGDGGWYHTEDGIFMQWGGPDPTGNPVVSSVDPISATIELQQGLDPLGAFLPGSDPPVPVVAPNILDVDATRFKKTYSYFRQTPVNVGVIQGGSNPAKP